MKLRLWFSEQSGQPRIATQFDTIYPTIDTAYDLTVEIQGDISGGSAFLLANGNTVRQLLAQEIQVVTLNYNVFSGEYLKLKVRYTHAGSVENSNEVNLLIAFDLDDREQGEAFCKITGFPEAGTQVEAGDTFQIGGTIYIARHAVTVPPEIDNTFLANFYINHTGGAGGIGNNNYEELENLPIIGGISVIGEHNIDYYGGYIKPSGGIPDIDINNLLVSDAHSAKALADSTAETVSTQGSQITNLNNAVQRLEWEKYAKPTDGIPKTDFDASVKRSLDSADSALQPDSTLDYTKIRTIPTATVLGNLTGQDGYPRPIPYSSGSGGGGVQTVTSRTNLINVDNADSEHPVIDATSDLTSAVAKANSAMQTLPLATETTAGGVYLSRTDGTGTNPAAVTRQYKGLAPIPTAADSGKPVVVGNGGTYELGAFPAQTAPAGGWQKSDLSSAVNQSLNKADTALQSFTETDPTVPAWAKGNAPPRDDTKMDKLITPMGNRLVSSNINGNTQETTATVADITTNAQAITVLNAGDDTQGSVSNKVKAERDRATAVESTLQSEIDLLNSRGSILGAYDFGVTTPTQAQLVTRALLLVFGENGTVTINVPIYTSTWTDGTTVHAASEIPNNSEIINLYNGHYWGLHNTTPSGGGIFTFNDLGQEQNVAIATPLVAGVVKSDYNDGVGEFVVGASGNVTLSEKYTAPLVIPVISDDLAPEQGTRRTLKDWTGNILSRIKGIFQKTTDLDNQQKQWVQNFNIVSANDRTTWDAKFDFPSNGLPVSQLRKGGANQIVQVSADGAGVFWRDPPSGGGGEGTITGVYGGNGLTGGGSEGDVTISMGNPSTLTPTTANTAGNQTHTHALSGVQPTLHGTEGYLATYGATDGETGGVSMSIFATAAQGNKADNAVQFVTQNLTESQKAQARENIGVIGSGGGGTLTDVVDNGSGTISTYKDGSVVHIGQAVAPVENTPTTQKIKVGESFVKVGEVTVDNYGRTTKTATQTITITHNHVGDVTSTESDTLTISDNAVTNHKLAEAPPMTVKCNLGNTAGTTEDATLDDFKQKLGTFEGKIKSIVAGAGLSGGGDAGDVTLALGSPTSVTAYSENISTGKTHSHALNLTNALNYPAAQGDYHLQVRAGGVVTYAHILPSDRVKISTFRTGIFNVNAHGHGTYMVQKVLLADYKDLSSIVATPYIVQPTGGYDVTVALRYNSQYIEIMAWNAGDSAIDVQVELRMIGEPAAFVPPPAPANQHIIRFFLFNIPTIAVNDSAYVDFPIPDNEFDLTKDILQASNYIDYRSSEIAYGLTNTTTKLMKNLYRVTVTNNTDAPIANVTGHFAIAGVALAGITGQTLFNNRYLTSQLLSSSDTLIIEIGQESIYQIEQQVRNIFNCSIEATIQVVTPSIGAIVKNKGVRVWSDYENNTHVGVVVQSADATETTTVYVQAIFNVIGEASQR